MARGLEGGRQRLPQRRLVRWKSDGSGCNGAGWWAGRRTVAAFICHDLRPVQLVVERSVQLAPAELQIGKE